MNLLLLYSYRPHGNQDEYFVLFSARWRDQEQEAESLHSPADEGTINMIYIANAANDKIY